MLFTTLLVTVLAVGGSGQNILTRVDQGIQQILEHLKERDRLDQQKEQEKIKETVELLNMDSRLTKIEQLIADVARQLRTASGRSGAATGEVQNLEIRIDSLESTVVSNVKGGVEKIENVQRQTDAIKSELEKRFGKIMNVMSAIHTQLKDNINSKSNPNENGDKGSEAIFMSEQLDTLETNMKEFLSVTKETLTSEIRNIKFEVLEPFQECRDLTQYIDDMKKQCDSSSSPKLTQVESGENLYTQSKPTDEHLIKDMRDNFMRNLTRIEREINDNLNKKLQDLEKRLSRNPVPSITPEHVQKEAVTEPPARNRSSMISSPSQVHERKQDKGQNVGENVEENVGDCKSLRYEVPQPHSCFDLKQAGASCSGSYIVFPTSKKAVYAYCDMVTDGGGWTVIMRRGEFTGKQVNFDQNWNSYKVGFGDINGEFWLGNENIRMLTSGPDMMTLQVSLEAFDGSHLNITFDEFWIEPEENHYKLHLGNLDRSEAYHGSSLRHHNERAFTTHDRNNEETGSQNCAIRYRGGWWYNHCHYALLTAPYFSKNQFRHKWQGMQWHAWKGSEALKSAEMRIRPRRK